MDDIPTHCRGFTRTHFVPSNQVFMSCLGHCAGCLTSSPLLSASNTFHTTTLSPPLHVFVHLPTFQTPSLSHRSLPSSLGPKLLIGMPLALMLNSSEVFLSLKDSPVSHVHTLGYGNCRITCSSTVRVKPPLHRIMMVFLHPWKLKLSVSLANSYSKQYPLS